MKTSITRLTKCTTQAASALIERAMLGASAHLRARRPPPQLDAPTPEELLATSTRGLVLVAFSDGRLVGMCSELDCLRMLASDDCWRWQWNIEFS